MTKAVQLVPAGARQVAPGIFQMTRRGHGGGSSKKHHGGGAKKHHRTLPLMSQSFVRYARQLASYRQFAAQFQAPLWLNIPALLLYLGGQQRKDKGAMNVGKTMLLDYAAQRNPQIAQMLQAGAGDLGMLGLLGGFGGGGGIPRGPITGLPYSPLATPDLSPSASPTQQVTDAIALANAVEEVV